MYKHQIEVQEVETSLQTPIQGTAALQVIFGTSCVNLAKDPYHATNVLIKADNFKDAAEQLGYNDNYDSYTLSQSMDACFKIFNVAPIIFCNVLDPSKHKKDNEAIEIVTKNHQAIIKKEGILLDKVEIKKEEIVLEHEKDYILSFDSSGAVVVTRIAVDAAETENLTFKSVSIDPTLVTSEDIIGGIDLATGKESGFELIRKVYPKFQLVPGLILAPGWSSDPAVAAVMALKCTDINGAFQCECLIDLDCGTSGAKRYTDCEIIKTQNNLSSKHSIVLWPEVKIGIKQFAYSAIYGALISSTDILNGDIPNLSPSNKLLKVDGSVLKDGTEIDLDQQQAADLNGIGIVTIINFGGWKAYGNNTACYPTNSDPKDRWIPCRRFFSWWANQFICTYASKIDNPNNSRLIESICDSENIKGNSLKEQGKCAGARIEYRPSENKIEDILNGKIKFRQFLAPYPPAEYILNVLEFDPEMLTSELGGE